MNAPGFIQGRRDATDPSGPTGRLASWLASFRLEDVPEAVRRRAAYLVLDGIGCALVGARLPWSRRAVASVCRLEGSGPASLIGWNRGVPAPAAALLNGTFIQGFELDDFHPFAPLHSASLVLPALLACAQLRGPVTGATFLKGAIAGFEVGPRIGLALHGIEMLSRGWHSGAVFGTHAAAAAAGTLIGLDAAAFEDALGLAGTQSAGLMAAQFEAMSKRMHHGFSARAGLYAAWLAADGYTGIKRSFERDYGGYLATFGEGHAPEASEVAKDLGERWETERIVVKPYAAMGGLHSAIDTIRAMRAERPFRVEDIANIDVWVGKAVFHHGAFPVERPLTSVGAQMSLAYAVAVAVLDDAAMIHQYTAERIAADDVWEMIPKVRMHEETRFQGAPHLKLRSRLRITFTDGSVREAERSLRMSDEISNEEIASKFRTLCEPVISADRRDRIEAAVLGLERAGDISDLFPLLAEETRPALGAQAD
ncbi:2-methylcitrate dehydratase PrpD [Enhydrobacter aerosaccus]|uniref:2-methylcitrate dehydratase PrpD n=1 Tax=Enhydrobacter aerosaccus TaxID=225324 RepID=A0A1T4K732_9HYPH|nr:MmgE/PrpD family protein [Enhydrobacter aerosaccus]SJZ38226.1 2-methylcitrate dehydratase PrpD [Enhydrobacter aerosaccus]